MAISCLGNGRLRVGFLCVKVFKIFSMGFIYCLKCMHNILCGPWGKDPLCL